MFSIPWNPCKSLMPNTTKCASIVLVVTPVDAWPWALALLFGRLLGGGIVGEFGDRLDEELPIEMPATGYCLGFLENDVLHNFEGLARPKIWSMCLSAAAQLILTGEASQQ